MYYDAEITNFYTVLMTLLETVQDTVEYEQLAANNCLIPNYVQDEGSSSDWYESGAAYDLYNVLYDIADSILEY